MAPNEALALDLEPRKKRIMSIGDQDCLRRSQNQ